MKKRLVTVRSAMSVPLLGVILLLFISETFQNAAYTFHRSAGNNEASPVGTRGGISLRILQVLNCFEKGNRDRYQILRKKLEYLIFSQEERLYDSLFSAIYKRKTTNVI